jgi:hypothetical protein
MRAVLVGVCVLLAGPALAAETQQQLADRLWREYRLVRSMKCVFEAKSIPTDSQMILNLKKLQAASTYHKSFTLEQMTYTAKVASARSFVKRWYRQGGKEMSETVDEGGRVTSETAFDGQTVRSLDHKLMDGRKSGSVYTVKTSDWDRQNRNTPLTLLFCYIEIPYAEIVEKATKFESRQVNQKGVAFSEYVVESPIIPQYTFVLRYDSAGFLAERDLIYARGVYGPREVHSRQVLGGYRAYQDKSGESIWYPETATYHEIVGILPDGTLVENHTLQFKVRDVEFNVELNDDIFVLKLPPDARVYDGINSMGYLQPGASIPSAPAPQSGVWRHVLVGVVVVFATLLSILAWRRRRRVATA